eukprot:5106117-Prymnesium_polylepis.1
MLYSNRQHDRHESHEHCGHPATQLEIAKVKVEHRAKGLEDESRVARAFAGPPGHTPSLTRLAFADSVLDALAFLGDHRNHSSVRNRLTL